MAGKERDHVAEREVDGLSPSFTQALIENSADVLSVVGLDGTIRFLSPSSERFFGWNPKEVLGRNLADFVHPDDLDGVGLAFQQATARAGFDGVTRARVRSADGSWRWTETVGTNLADDPVVQGLVLISRDVTAQVEEEEQLRASEASFRRVFFLSPQPMWIIDANSGHFIEANDAALDLYGYSRAEFLALGVSAVDGGAEALAGATGRRRHRRRDGKELVVDLTVEPTDWYDQPCLLVVARDVTEQVVAEDELIQRAFHDSLTGVANRALLFDRAAQLLSLARRNDHGVALLVVDVDRFKEINDSAGHAAGDAVLCELASRLLSSVRPSDTVARLGGDEFAVLVAAGKGEDSGPRVARRILSEVAVGFGPHAHFAEVSVSVGVAAGNGEVDFEELLQAADAAMYAAKKSGGGRFAVSSSAIP